MKVKICEASQGPAIRQNLMAFGHVATKIYSFLIDWDKLEVIIDDIQENHVNIKPLFVSLLDTLTSPE